jgi:hypothetical protein
MQQRTPWAATVVLTFAVVLGLSHPPALATGQQPYRAAEFDVRDYGAKGTGSADDTPAVIADAASGIRWAASTDSTRYRRLRVDEAWIGTSYVIEGRS